MPKSRITGAMFSLWDPRFGGSILTLHTLEKCNELLALCPELTLKKSINIPQGFSARAKYKRMDLEKQIRLYCYSKEALSYWTEAIPSLKPFQSCLEGSTFKRAQKSNAQPSTAMMMQWMEIQPAADQSNEWSEEVELQGRLMPSIAELLLAEENVEDSSIQDNTYFANNGFSMFNQSLNVVSGWQNKPASEEEKLFMLSNDLNSVSKLQYHSVTEETEKCIQLFRPSKPF